MTANNGSGIVFSTDAIRQGISPEHSDIAVCLFDLIDSTNSEAKRMFLSGDHRDKLILSLGQTDGKGRLGRSFYSPSQSGLYMTLAVTTDRPLADILGVTVAASVAVLRAVKRNTGLTLGIKWVNDLYLNDKKVCGILAQGVPGCTANHLILGIGINLFTENFPEQIREIAGSLCVECNVNSLVCDIVNELFGYLDAPETCTYMEEYKKHSIVLGKEVVCMRANERFVGVAEQITDQGALVVRDEDGNAMIMDSGEISLRFTS